MAKERVKFVEGARRLHGLEERRANEIFDLLNKFASYGFNKSHSAAYALVSYQTAYLKANYPVEFMAAVLTSELGNAEKLAHFIAECEAMGLTVLGPDVNESRETFTPLVAGGPRAIRFGLAGIKGVGEAAAQRILAERERGGPYRDFDDFIQRVDPKALNKRVLEHLVKTGAFDFSGASRKRLFDGIDAALAAASSQARDRAAGQNTFLDLLAEPAPAPRRSGPGAGSRGAASAGGSRPAPPGAASADAADEFSAAERLQFEKELLGFYLSGHPLNAYAGLCDALDTFAPGELLAQADRTEFRLCGVVGNLAKKLSKKDNRPWMAFTLATKQATLPLNMFADAYASYGHLLTENAVVAVLGTILKGDDGARINVKECYPLDAHTAQSIRRVTWLVDSRHVEAGDFLTALRTSLNAHVGDTRTELAMAVGEGFAPVAEISTALGWKVSGTEFQRLRTHPAVLGVEVEAKTLSLKEVRRWPKRGER
jgi:DNA polymerase-3 subunit alpha